MTDQNDAGQLELAISLPVMRPDVPQYPETFALFPIFAPVNDRSKMDTDWKKRGQFSYSFPWGDLERHGPGLNIYDEDTLIALFHLARQHRHEGAPGKFPIPLAGESTIVYSGVVSPWEVNKFLSRPDSGSALKETWESIERLALTTLTITTSEGGHTNIKLFEHRAANFKDSKAKILIQFPPAVVSLLLKVVNIDIPLRMSLSVTGKAIHRHLVALGPGLYEIAIGDFMERIHYTGRPGDFRDQLIGRSGRSSILGQLQTGGVIGEYQLAGRGKKATFVIEVL
jgi:hypothetical protein